LQDLSIQLLAPDLWKWIAALVPALCLAFWTYYRILAPLSTPTRLALWTLRGLAFTLVLFALWQPVATVVIPERGKPRLAVLLDDSASMGLPATAGSSQTRREQVRDLAGLLDTELASEYDVQWLRFDDTIRAAADSVGPATGNTAIGGALEQVLVRAASKPVHGIVVVSDGVNTEGRDPVRIARGCPVPIFAVGVGATEPPADLEIRKVLTNAKAFSGEPLPIQVVLSSTGMAGQKVSLVVRSEGEVVGSEEVELVGDKGLEQEIRFEIRPHRSGLLRYEIEAALANDPIPENNLREVAVEVAERKTRVLCVADAVDWDFGFLRTALSADTTLEYSYLVRTAGSRYSAFGATRATELPLSPGSLQDFAAVLVVSTGAKPFPADFLTALGGFVRGGGGLFLLGGPSAGEWSANRSLAGILPGRTEPRQSRSGAAAIECTAQGMRHPVTALRDNPGETARLFAALPPTWRLESAMRAAPGAKELLRYRDGETASAALAVGFGDRGKVAWWHGRGLWRWKLSAAGRDLSTYAYSDLLTGMVRWLAEPAIRERFQVEPGKRVYSSGETTSFTASVWDNAFRPIEGVDVRLSLRSADSTEAVASELNLVPGSEPGQYDVRGPSLIPGHYQFDAIAEDADGSEVGQSSGEFWVERMGPEYTRTWADPEALRQIAEQSDGVFVDQASIAALFERIPSAIQRLGRVKEFELWNHWILFALFVLVLSTEWFLRRRRGLA